MSLTKRVNKNQNEKIDVGIPKIVPDIYYYIATVGKDKKPYNSPCMFSNLVGIYGPFDPESPPEPFEKIIVHAPPALGIFDVYEGVVYERNKDGVFEEYHKVRSMTSEERETKLEFIQSMFPFKGWNFDTETRQFHPPEPYPDHTKKYIWNNDTKSWELVDSWPVEWLRDPGNQAFTIIQNLRFVKELSENLATLSEEEREKFLSSINLSK